MSVKSDQLNPMQAMTAKEMEALIANIRNSQQPPIRNYKNAPKGLPELPPIDLSTVPMSPYPANPYVMDFGIKYHADQPKQQRALTTEECNELFGVATAVKMNFIPQMLNSLMMQQATLLVNYCRDNRVSETKKHTRVIKLAVEEYAERLKEAYGPAAFRAYVNYSERFQRETATNVWMMEMHADSLCRNQVPNEKHYPIFIRALVIVMLIRFCQNYDKEMDKLIASKIGQPVHQKPDVYQQSILAMCLSLAEDLGYKINPDKIMGDWVRVLSNKAHLLADQIPAEESES